MTLKASIKSMRLRTLPLSLAGVILGVTLAADKTDVSPWTAALIFDNGMSADPLKSVQ